ncbi:helix-turn-helix domain-containing protein [Paenarthrobacter sp. YAF11_1]|uniref:helix-turn-helix domain-containing protein n=1 Tax=Paenarthrobacter sp. YAF11_1 TaxID=3233074 RepID=UPI003F9DEEE5
MTAGHESSALRLYTVEEASKLLGTSKTYVYERIRAGDLRTVDLGTGERSKIRIRQDDLEHFIDSRTSTTQ